MISSGVIESERIKESLMEVVAKLEQTAKDYDDKLEEIKMAEAEAAQLKSALMKHNFCKL